MDQNNNIQKSKPVPPFVRYCSAIIPTMFDDSLSYYEALCALWKWLQDNLVDVINNNAAVTEEYIRLVKELKDYVENYFENLDVQEEINKKLDEMAEDGTLDTIIRRYIDLDPDVAESMPYLRKGRKVVARPTQIPNSGGYKAMQGGVMDSDYTFSYVTTHNDDNGSVDSEMCKVQKININTGEVLQQAEVELYHANSMAYDRTTGHYYVATAHDRTNTNTNKIIELDSSFAYIRTIDTDKNYDSITVDENGVLYAGFTYSGSVYAYTIDKLDKVTFDIEETIELQPRHELGFATGQDFCIYDKRVYLISSFPNTIEIFDIAGNPIKVYTANDRDYIYIGETENISTWDGKDFIFGSCCYRLESCYMMNQVFVTDFQIGCGRELEKDRFVSRTYNVYIDSSQEIWNPDGTSAKPFYCIDEINYIDTNMTIVANFKAGDYYAYTVLPQSCNFECGSNTVHIKAGKNNIIDVIGCKLFINGSSKKMTIDSLRAWKNSDVYVYETNLKKTNPAYLLEASQNSVITMSTCAFDTTETYTTAFFVNDRGKFIYSGGNTSIVNKGTTRFFSGKITFNENTPLFTGTLAKDGSTTINGGYNTSFKELLIKFTDQNFGTFTLDGGNRANYLFTNLSSSGTGNNVFYNVDVEKQNDNTLKLIKANAIVFASDGTMTVNTSPSFNLTAIYAR